MRFESRFFGALQARLGGPLPGLAAQAAMAPLPRPAPETILEEPEGCAQAAVTIILYPKAGVVQTVFIRRAQTVLHHKDQISFPGGQIEGEETIDEAALRETREEIGVEPGRLKILGHLTALYIEVSDFCVHPVVAVADEPLEFIPDPVEVAGIIEVPLARLADPASVGRETRTLRDRGPVDVPYYAFGEHKIWGATAMILAEFVEIIRSLSGPS
jgi:8-oxo-dGTP pyrophosphatase MutT (NUDIX family)